MSPLKVLILISSISSSYCSIECKFTSNTYYTCAMTINDGGDFSQVIGTHDLNKTNADVIRLRVENGSLQRFPEEICEHFKNLKLIDEWNIEINEISENSFKKCENLEDLKILLSNDLKIHEKSFENNLKLKKLVIKNNDDSSSLNWKASWFQSMIHLQEIIINDKRVKEIPRNAFHHLCNLTKIDISNSEFRVFNYESFGNLEKLERIIGYSNQINSMDFNIFDQSKVLDLVDVYTQCNSGNLHIPSFQEHKVENLRNLEACFLSFDARKIEFTTNPSDDTSELDYFSIRGSGIRVTIKIAHSAEIYLLSNSHDLPAPIKISLDFQNISTIHENGVQVKSKQHPVNLSEDLESIFFISWTLRHLIVRKEGESFPLLIHQVGRNFVVNFFAVKSRISSGVWKVRILKN